jgi:hypothetical protein
MSIPSTSIYHIKGITRKKPVVEILYVVAVGSVAEISEVFATPIFMKHHLHTSTLTEEETNLLKLWQHSTLSHSIKTPKQNQPYYSSAKD